MTARFSGEPQPIASCSRCAACLASPLAATHTVLSDVSEGAAPTHAAAANS